MRLGTTVVETNIHYLTASSSLGDGVRALIRTMKKITTITGEAGARLCDHSRTVRLWVLDIARAARSKAKQSRENLARAYGKLRNSTSRGGTGEAVLQGDRRTSEARFGSPQAADAGGPASGTRCDGAAHQAGDEADQSAQLPW